jgi:hypothetical protein
MPEQKQNIDDVINQLSSQLAQANAIKQQQAQEKKKKKSLKQIVGEGYLKTATTIKRLPEYKERALTGLDGILGSGIRSTATTYAMAAAALPILLSNPLGIGVLAGAGLTACAAGLFGYVTSNVGYKLMRDAAYIGTYPILRPMKFLKMAPILLHPIKLVKGMMGAPFKFMGRMLTTYPLKAKRSKAFAFGPDGKPTAGTNAAGVNKYARMAGQIFGGVAGAGLLSGNPLYKLESLAASAKDYVVDFAGSAAAKYAPAYAYR